MKFRSKLNVKVDTRTVIKDFILLDYLKLLVKSINRTIKSILGLVFSVSSGNGRLVATRLQLSC